MTPGGDLAWAAVKMVIALLVVLGGMVLCYWAVRRFMGSQMSGARSDLMKVVNTLGVAPKAKIFLVKVPGRVLVIGLCGQQMKLLSEITDEASLEKIEGYLQQASAGNFMEQLKKISVKTAPAATDVKQHNDHLPD